MTRRAALWSTLTLAITGAIALALTRADALLLDIAALAACF